MLILTSTTTTPPSRVSRMSWILRVGSSVCGVLVCLSAGCAGRASVDAGDGLSGGGAVHGQDGGGTDGAPNGAYTVHFGASVSPPHQCRPAPVADGATAGEAGTAAGYFTLPDLRCAWSDTALAATVASPTGAVVPASADEAAVRAAIQAAGVDGVVAFTGGETYVLHSSLAPLKGQRWTRAGTGRATLRRGDARVTTLATATAVGATILDVASATHFPVGAQLTVVAAAETGANQTAASGCPLSHRVVSGSGTQLQILPPLTRPFAVGDKVISAFAMVEVHAADVRIDGLVFDGNASGNPDYAAAETFEAIAVSQASRVRLENNELHDGPADLVSLRACVDCVVSDNRLRDAHGAALRLADTLKLLALRNRLTHIATVSGAIRWAGGNVQAWLDQNCISDTVGPAFGQTSASDRGLKLHNNQLLRVGGVLVVPPASAAKGGETGQPGGILSDLEVSENFGVQVGALTIGAPVNSAARPVVLANDARLIGVRVRGNRWLGGSVEICGCSDVSVLNNTLADLTMASPKQTLAATLIPPAADGFGAALVTLRGVVDAQITNNVLLGGPRGLWLEQRGVGGSRGVLLQDNMLLGQTKVGMTLGDAAAMVAATPGGATPVSGVTCSDNTVKSGLIDGGASRWGVMLGHGTHFLGNCVESPRGVLLDSVAPDQAATNTQPTVVVRNSALSTDPAATAQSIGALGSGGGLYLTANWLRGVIASQIVKSAISTVSGNFATKVGCGTCWPDPALWLQLPDGAAVEVRP